MNNKKEKMLFSSCIQGDFDTIKKIVKSDPSLVNKISTLYGTPLITIISENPNMDIIKFLIENGADINFSSKSGKTPLLIACEQNNKPLVEYLIQQGADINEPEMLRNQTPLMTACEMRFWDIAELLLKQKTIDVNKINFNNRNALMIGCDQKETDQFISLLPLFVEKGININQKDIMKQTALMLASKHGNLKIVEFLLQNGAEINLKNKWGYSALWFAIVEAKNIPVAELLLKYGEDINSKNFLG